MRLDIDKMRNDFFKKSLSAGHHNVKYTWMQLMLMIISCVRGLESFHESMWVIAKELVRGFCRFLWWISVDETYVPFFGNRKKLNQELQKKGVGKLAPRAIVLADRGFGKAVWFFEMLDATGAKYVIRVLLRKKENKNKVAAGATRFQYWMKEHDTNKTVLLTVHVAKDEQKREYYLASNIENKTGKQLLTMYLNRWDLENIFKDADRVELPTSSRNPRMRLFSVVLSFFLFTFWQVSKLFSNTSWSLRTFVKKVITAICQFLNCTIKTTGELLKPPP